MKISEKIKAITIIPGTGEFVYDPRIVRGEYNFLNSFDGEKSHLEATISYLKDNYPNLEKIGLMVGWFGDSTHAGKIKIAPKIENKSNPYNTFWKVGHYDKSNAATVSYINDIPSWGGTISDEALFGTVKRFNEEGYEIMLTPVVYLDLSGKPWRGNIRAYKAGDVEHFFTEYKKFINHYAKLKMEGESLAEYLESFIIGSELKELMAYKDVRSGLYTAVDMMVMLADELKSHFDGDVRISYSANWAEYHHDDLGFHHLDKLWVKVDFVAISAYFPLTKGMGLVDPSYHDIKVGWGSGLNYDYWLDAQGKKHHLDPDYAVKNIAHWWSSLHHNPDGSITSWKPRMKPVVFSECGFASLAGTTDDPGAFVDFTSYSYMHLQPDIAIQAKAINATIDFWQEQKNEFGLVGDDIYFYAVDIRNGFQNHPEYYQDAGNYHYGHWLKVVDFDH